MKYPSDTLTWFSDSEERVALLAVVLHILEAFDAEGTRAAAGEGSQEKAAGDAGSPHGTSVGTFRPGDSAVTARVTLEEHRDMRGSVDDPIGLHQRHLLINDMLMQVAWLRLGH